MKQLGGKATGSQICDWFVDHSPQTTETDRKALAYKINAILSSKKHSNLFLKKKTSVDGGKQICIWSLRDPNSATENLDQGESSSDSTEPESHSASNKKAKFLDSDSEVEISKPKTKHSSKSDQGCQVCNHTDFEEQILLCDNCDGEYHTFCLDPPLDDIPLGNWYCPKCKPMVEDVAVAKESQNESQDLDKALPNELVETDTQTTDLTGELDLDAVCTVAHVERALENLGGKGTGVEVTKWIADTFDVPSVQKKGINHRVNAILGANMKKFKKEATQVEGSHRTSIWKLHTEVTTNNDEKSQTSTVQESNSNSQANTTFTDLELRNLVEGVQKYGCNWVQILRDFSFNNKSEQDLQNKWVQMTLQLLPIQTKESSNADRPKNETEKSIEVKRTSSETPSKKEKASSQKNEQSETTCEVCKSAADADKILLCDSCDKEFHLYCLEPALKKVPKGRWFCPECKQNFLNSTSGANKDPEFYKFIVEALQKQGKPLSGKDIVEWLIANNPNVASINQIALTYRVNAILSSKSYNHMFVKLKAQKVDDDGRSAALWTLKSGEENQAMEVEEPKNESLLAPENTNVVVDSEPKQKKQDKTDTPTGKLRIVDILVNALAELSEPSSGTDITQHIFKTMDTAERTKHFGFRDATDLARLRHRIVAYLSSKSYSHLFTKHSASNASTVLYGLKSKEQDHEQEKLEEDVQEKSDQLSDEENDSDSNNSKAESSSESISANPENDENSEDSNHCKICNKPAVVGANHPENMTKFYERVMNWKGVLVIGDKLCRSCYNHWYKDSRGLSSESKSKKKQKHSKSSPESKQPHKTPCLKCGKPFVEAFKNNTSDEDVGVCEECKPKRKVGRPPKRIN